jgi:hypothetical protein
MAEVAKKKKAERSSLRNDLFSFFSLLIKDKYGKVNTPEKRKKVKQASLQSEWANYGDHDYRQDRAGRWRRRKAGVEGIPGVYVSKDDAHAARSAAGSVTKAANAQERAAKAQQGAANSTQKASRADQQTAKTQQQTAGRFNPQQGSSGAANLSQPGFFSRGWRRAGEWNRERRTSNEVKKTQNEQRKLLKAEQKAAKTSRGKSQTRQNIGGGVLDTVGDPGFILFIAGFLTFAFESFLNNAFISTLLGTIFMFYASLFIFKGRGIILTIVFWMWFVFFGGVTSISSIGYIIVPIMLVAMLIHGVFGKLSGKESFSGGAAGELIGLVSITVFFLEIGLIPLLTQNFNIALTPMLQNFILFIPWWGLLGLFTSQKDNMGMTIIKILGVGYVSAILLFGVAPQAYSSSQSAIPGVDDFLKAKEDIKSSLPQRENPFFSQLACTFSGSGNEVQRCVEKRQEDSEFEYICNNDERYKGKTLNECKSELRAERESEKIRVTGISDPTIAIPLTAKFVVDRRVSDISYRKVNEPTKVRYAADFKGENPRQQEIEVEFFCSFESPDKKMNVPGEIVNEQKTKINGLKIDHTVLCQPAGDLDGRYRLKFQAKMNNLWTKSRLQRAFIGELVNQEEIEKRRELVDLILRTHFSGTSQRSQGPADLARINFAFGQPPEYPILEGGEISLLSSDIENLGQGKILAVHQYKIDLPGFIVDDPESGCLDGFAIELPSQEKFTRRSINLPICVIDWYPPELQDPEQEYVYREFEAFANYDYLVEYEVSVEMQVLGKGPEENRGFTNT